MLELLLYYMVYDDVLNKYSCQDTGLFNDRNVL